MLQMWQRLPGVFDAIEKRIVAYMKEPEMPDLDTMKRDVIAFYELMFNDCRPAEAIARYAGQDYIQHNPHVASGKQASSTTSIAWLPITRQTCRGETGFCEGNHVVLHCHQVWPGGLEYAGIDIFRLDEAGKIVEHWDVLQELPETSANANGMF